MGVHRNIDANFLRGVMPKVPSKKHPYENFGMPYVFLWILHFLERFPTLAVCEIPFHTSQDSVELSYRNDLFEEKLFCRTAKVLQTVSASVDWTIRTLELL